jgi:hypothetical protein
MTLQMCRLPSICEACLPTNSHRETANLKVEVLRRAGRPILESGSMGYLDGFFKGSLITDCIMLMAQQDCMLVCK